MNVILHVDRHSERGVVISHAWHPDSIAYGGSPDPYYMLRICVEHDEIDMFLSREQLQSMHDQITNALLDGEVVK